MKLYLLRHGDAERKSSHGDRGRELTEVGRSQAKVAGKYLKDLRPGVVLISTFARAKQTLEIMHRESGWCSLREFVSLDVAPAGNVDDLMIEVNAYQEDSVLIVGHNPQLSELVYHLTKKNISMGNCSFATIDLETSELLDFKKVEEM